MNAISWRTHTVQPAGEHLVLTQAAWFVAGAATAFALPYFLTGPLDVPGDLYYAFYFAAVATFLTAFVVETGFPVREVASRHWRSSLVVGAVTAVLLVFLVLRREDSTARPDGWYFAFTVGWRGILYGLFDAALLSAFPAAVVYTVMRRNTAGWTRRGTFALATLLLSAVITAVYHLGYEQFRDDGVGGPEIGNTIISLPVAATGNPLGSFIAHATMHVTADVHAYETEVFLPPERTAE